MTRKRARKSKIWRRVDGLAGCRRRSPRRRRVAGLRSGSSRAQSEHEGRPRAPWVPGDQFGGLDFRRSELRSFLPLTTSFDPPDALSCLASLSRYPAHLRTSGQCSAAATVPERPLTHAVL